MCWTTDVPLRDRDTFPLQLKETVNTHTILDFIKEIGFYNRI